MKKKLSEKEEDWYKEYEKEKERERKKWPYAPKSDKKVIKDSIRSVKEMEKNLGFWRAQLDKRKSMAENPDWTELKRSIYPLTMKEQHQNLYIIKYEILVSFAVELSRLREILENQPPKKVN